MAEPPYNNGAFNGPEKLVWKIDETIQNALKAAQDNANKIINDSDIHVVHFNDFGADYIKQQVKVSPDAFVQMAIQLAFYRIHSQLTAVYETASTRQYLHGRTETTRSLSNDSAAFVKSFDSLDKSPTEKLNLLKKACTSHVNYVIAASNGKKFDRHLLGLQMCVQSGEQVDFFKDPVFAKSRYFRLSTSNLYSTPQLLGTGFGAVVPDGYGMNYMINRDHIKIGIESKRSCPETSTALFAEALKSSWRDMKKVVQEASLSNKL